MKRKILKFALKSMSGLIKPAKISVAQLSSNQNTESSFKVVQRLVEEASIGKSKMVFFPEHFCGIKKNFSVNQELLDRYKSLAAEYDIFISYGGYPEKINEMDEKSYNTHIIVNPQGEIISKYRKIHLFDVDMPGFSFKESNTTISGDSFVVCPNTPVGTLGLSVCYDVRFPEQFIYMSQQMEATTFCIPSMFPTKTGELGHYHTLMKARAIENQCYVIVSAQTGRHNEKMESYGHSLVIDPLGRIVMEIDQNQRNCVLSCDIDLNQVFNYRNSLPVAKHRNYDVYDIVTRK